MRYTFKRDIIKIRIYICRLLKCLKSNKKKVIIIDKRKAFY
jgi:hypothetical protein